MQNDLQIKETLKNQGFNTIDVYEILNYLETLDYELDNTRYIGQINSKNERLAKYFFLRDQLKIEIDSLNESSHVYEILDQCIDWSEFWRLLVTKKGFCCIRLTGEINNKKRYIFMYGPNILSGPFADRSNSIYDINY